MSDENCTHLALFVSPPTLSEEVEAVRTVYLHIDGHVVHLVNLSREISRISNYEGSCFLDY